ncbi:response regulator transcription factor [Bacteroidota bacterium]
MEEQEINILVVEDDKNAGYLLCENLQMSGYKPVLAYNGKEAFHLFQNNQFDLCIIDIMLPLMDGHELAKKIRKSDEIIPIIFLTARNLDKDKIEGFQIGCDDYITKPYNLDELLLRIRAILKRINTNAFQLSESEYAFGEFTFNYSEHLIKSSDEQILLSTKENDLLKVLVDNKNQVVSRNQIMSTVWGSDDFYISKCLDVYLTRLRKKIAPVSNIKIINIHGFGYKLLSNV